jgi:hypothetical protein
VFECPRTVQVHTVVYLPSVAWQASIRFG